MTLLPDHLKRTADLERVGLIGVLTTAKADGVSFAGYDDAENVDEDGGVFILPNAMTVRPSDSHWSANTRHNDKLARLLAEDARE